MNSLNAWTNLKELRVFSKHDNALREIQLQHLKKLIFLGGITNCADAWKDFGEINPQLEHLEVNYIFEFTFLNHLEKILRVWPNLKRLHLGVVFRSAREEILATKLIEKYGRNLEYLKMNLQTVTGKKAMKSLQRRLPNLRGEIQVFGQGNGSFVF